MSLKAIKGLPAKDITMYTDKQVRELPKLYKTAYSSGINGRNGLVLEDSEGNIYKIVGRCTTLFIV